MPNLKAIILVGSRDFGRCPLASRRITSSWPLVGKTVLEHLLTHLADEGIRDVVVCSGEAYSWLTESMTTDDRLKVEFLHEPLPVGTAGCLRDAGKADEEELCVIFSASIVSPPKMDELIEAHNAGQSDLTVFVNPTYDGRVDTGQASGIYVCESSVLEHIPEAGYVDIKEGLIPEMLRAGRTVHAATLPNHVGNFRDWRGYLYAVCDYLERTPKLNDDIKSTEGTLSGTVWIASDAEIDPSVRMKGPVVVMDGARISSDAVVLGPAVIGRRVTVGPQSVVVHSVIWDDARIGPHGGIRRCVIDDHAVVPAGALVEDTTVALKPKSILRRFIRPGRVRSRPLA